MIELLGAEDDLNPQETPHEKYGRVTNPGRYAVLHEFATELLEQLERDFEVRSERGVGLDGELESGCALARSTVRLSPATQSAASLAMAFTSFPGLHVRFGLWSMEAFPACGCDACNERPEELIRNLKRQVEDLVAGYFREEIENLGSDGAWYTWRFPSISALGGKRRLDPNEVRRLLSGRRRSSYEWRPWSCRTAT